MQLRFVCTFIALSLTAMAQNKTILTGLPELKVYLGGSGTNPVISNHSAKALLGYTLLVKDEGGLIVRPILHIDRAAAGIAGLAPGSQETYSPAANRVRLDGTPANITSVTLDSVISADGEFAGPDTMNQFQRLHDKIETARVFALRAVADPSLVETTVKSNRSKNLTRQPGQMSDAFKDPNLMLAEQLYQIQQDSGIEALNQALKRLSELPALRKGATK